MSYDITFRVKVEGVDHWIDTPVNTDANITWNVREIITRSTGLEWNNEQNNGLVKDIMPKIEAGMVELHQHPEKYWQYEPDNGWGSVKSVISFFQWLLNDWEKFQKSYETRDLVDVVTFWII